MALGRDLDEGASNSRDRTTVIAGQNRGEGKMAFNRRTYKSREFCGLILWAADKRR